MSAQRVIFDDAELAAFLRDKLYPLAGLTDVDAEQQVSLARAFEALYGLDGNAALLLHCEGRPADEVQRYIERYALITPREAAKMIEFIQDPLRRTYVFNYAMGKALLAPLLEGPDAAANFYRLLSEPFTPTQIRLWLAQRGASLPS